MYKRIKIYVSLLLVIAILFTTFILTTIDTGMAFAQTDTIRLNEFKKVYLEGVEVKTYYFTPNSDGYFVAETTGNLDTRLKISSSSGLFIINDDGGINNNSRIYFKAEKGVQITIDVRLYEDYSSDDASSGYIELQLRKQRFSMFSYVDVNGNNLIENLEKPNSLFKNLFECSKYENHIKFSDMVAFRY